MTTTRKIGEIATETGLTVRTLRYYEEIGLIAPESRTDAGHRLYGAGAVERLYKISLLRQLGLPLESVQAGLDSPENDLRTLLADHLVAVDTRLAAEHRLRAQLAQLNNTLEANEDTASALLNVMEDMTMLETNLDRRIAILVYEDLEEAFEYLTRVYGFGPGELTRHPDGTVVHGEIQAGDVEFWLHGESDEWSLRSPNNLGGTTGLMAIMVDDVDAHYRGAVERGAEIRYEPVDQPYGYREYSAVDIGGHMWSFMKPL